MVLDRMGFLRFTSGARCCVDIWLIVVVYAMSRRGTIFKDVPGKSGINCTAVRHLLLHRIISICLDLLLHSLFPLDAQSDDFHIPALHIDQHDLA